MLTKGTLDMGVWEQSVLSSQFFCKFETVLNKESLLKIKPRPGAEAQACNPNTVGGPLEPKSLRPAWETWGVSTKNFKN